MHKNTVSKIRRPIRIPSPERLANIALHYLSRYAASENALRSVLQNRIRRASMRDAAFAADTEKHKQLHTVIETIIEKHRKSGILNDASYAEAKVSSLRRSGKSRRIIQQKLQLKGVSAALINEALKKEDGDGEELEMKAAITLAKKKKLGPYRGMQADQSRKQKDIAAMARAGFSLDIIRKVFNREFFDDENF